MKPIMIVRLVIDLAFTVLLLCALMYRTTGDTAHEWIGVSAGAVYIAHNALNGKWYKTILKGAYNVRRGVLTAVNLLLAFTFVILIVTGLLHSRTVLAFLHLPGGMMIRQIHTIAAYWCLPLIGIHLGLNWGVILNAFRKLTKTNGGNHTRKIILRIITLTFVAFGVWSSFDRDMFSKLFLGFSFDYWPEERPAILFFAVNISIMGLYVSAAYYALKTFDWIRLRGIREPPGFTDTEIPLSDWTRSLCKTIEYPAFGDPESVVLPDTLTEQMSQFTGFACYETIFVMDNSIKLFLEISHTSGSAEVFMNGETAGMRITPPYRYDLSSLARQGKNYLAIEIAINLGKNNRKITEGIREKTKHGKHKGQSDIIGTVRLYTN